MTTDIELTNTSHSFVAVPAIGGDPEQTWIPRPDIESEGRVPRLGRSISNTHSATLITLGASAVLAPLAHGAFPKRATHSPLNSPSPIHLQFPEKELAPFAWPTHDLRDKDSRARVLLYDHGKPKDTDDLFELARRLLAELMKDDGRKSSKNARPLFFLCHSTGGLVAKAAVAIAASGKEYESIASQCIGFTFFATPHRGSSYLASTEFSESISEVMGLRWNIPQRLLKSFGVNHQDQTRIANMFRPISTELKIFSFYEATDTELLIHTLNSGASVTPYRAPITSIKSAILDLENEHEIPLQTDHTGTAAFQGDTAPLFTHLEDLKHVIDDAIELSSIKHHELDLDENVHVEINGFYEDGSLGVSEASPLTMWSSRKSLTEFLKLGPRKSLEARLQEPMSQEARARRSSVIGLTRERHPHADQVNASTNRPQARSFQSVDEVPKLQSQAEGQAEETPEVTKLNIVPNGTDRPSPSVRVQREASFPTELPIDPSSPSLETPPPRRQLSSTQQSMSDPAELARRLDSYSFGSRLDPKATLSVETRRQSDVFLKPSSGLPLANRQPTSIGYFEHRPFKSTPSKKADTTNHKFSWIHVPFNHTGWVPPILQKVSADGSDVAHLNLLHHENWSDKFSKGRHAAPHARFVKPMCIYSSVEVQKQRGVRTPSQTQLALYLPYLHWDSYKQLLKRRDLISRRMTQGRVRPVPKDVADAKALEAKVIWQYLGSEPPFHCRRTLDQFGYPNLRNTKARDDDQILYKRTKERSENPTRKMKPPKQGKKVDKFSPDSQVADGKVLMVDQLWLWMMDQTSVVTLFPRKESSVAEGRLYR